MNITNINAHSSSKADSGSTRQQSIFAGFQKGQQVDGLISKVSDRISINFSGTEVSVPGSAVHNAREGEIRKFQIMDVSDKGIVLKEIGNSADGRNSIQAVFTNVRTDQASFTEQLKQASEQKQKEEDAKEAEDTLNDTADRMTEDDCRGFAREGISLEEYELEILNRALERIKQQRQFKEHGLENQVEKQKVSEEQFQDMSSDTADNNLAKYIIKKLKDSALPVTEENVEKIAQSAELAKEVTSIGRKEERYLLKNSLSVSAQNLYKAKYAGGADESQRTLSGEEWEQLKPQSEKIVREAGLDINNQNLGKAKWLLENEIPLTKENLMQLESMEKLKDGINMKQIVDRIVDGMKNNFAPDEAPLTDDSYEQAEDFVRKFQGITKDAVNEAGRNGWEMNLRNLSGAQEIVGAAKTGIKNGEVDIQQVTAYRQLEEIRLKMTVEAAQKLIGKGIKLDTDELGKIVEGLKQIEDDYYRSILKEAGASDDAENTDLLRETTQKANTLKSAPEYLLGNTIELKEIQTVDTLYAQGTELKAKLDKAGISYESLMTQPRTDLGDSIQKAFQNTYHMLSEMNMEDTEANRRALRILGYNGMEITPESVMEMKAYDAQMNELLNNLHPAVTVHLIKEGINPLNVPIGELNKQLDDIKDQMDLSGEEKYGRYLWKLERQEGITPEERKAYIGLYRLLNNIKKTDGAAIGSVLQAEKDVTLNNLLTAVKTMQKKGIDASVDDSFGLLENIHYERENISSQLGGAFNKNEGGKKEQKDYSSGLLNQIQENISPEKLKQIGTPEEIMNYSLEKLKEKLEALPEDTKQDKEYYKEQVERIKELSRNSTDAIKLVKDLEMPDSVRTVSLAEEFLSRDRNISRRLERELKEHLQNTDEKQDLEEVLDEFPDVSDSREGLAVQYEKLGETVNRILNREYGDNTLTSRDLADLKMINGGVQFVKAASAREHYQIPLLVGESVTNVNLTIIHGGENSGKIDLNIESEKLGNMSGTFTVKAGKAKGFLSCDTRFGMEALKMEDSTMKEMIRSAGFELTQMDYGLFKNVDNSYHIDHTNSEQPDSVTTKQLYRTAKTILTAVKAAELKAADQQ